MDLSFSKEEVAFRDEVRAFFRDNVPGETRKKLVEGRHLSKDEMVTTCARGCRRSARPAAC